MFAALLVFSEFLTGKFYFAYLDIGSDSLKLWVPQAMHLARSWARDGFAGWSFQLGLGGPTAVMLGDLANLLGQSVGVENILPARIFVYLLKVASGGGFFLLFIRYHVTRWQSAVLSSLAYSFCGFMVINGQWDTEATSFVFYPLVLWTIVRHLRTGGIVLLPLAIATSLFFGIFFISLGVFLVLTCVAFVACSDAPKAALKTWVGKIFPLTALGYLLAAPYLLPVMFQLMDSARASGSQSLIQGILVKSITINEWSLIVAQIGGIFHKDIYGVGSNYTGYFNYLEGPGFFIGVTLLLVIPHLWAGSRADKKALVLGVVAVAAYFLFPVFRYAAMGFAAPYFRVSTLWVSIVGLVLAAKALDQILTQGVRVRLLVFGLAFWGLMLAIVMLDTSAYTVWMPHVGRIAELAALSAAVMVLAHRGRITQQRLPLALMLVTLVEVVVISRPSYVSGRKLVSPELRAYDDITTGALAAIRTMDRGVFRIEKDYNSVSLADALAQDYMGVKSYSLHSRGVVDFYLGTGLIPPTSPVVNYSNWLPSPGPRFILTSLLGVKYFIAINAFKWPGFVELGTVPGLHIYRNDMALPLGVVQTRQVTKDALASISARNVANAVILADAALFNAAVVEQLIPGYGSALNMEVFLQSKSLSLEDFYFSPAAELQKTGLQVDSFSNERITGHIAPTSAGILVFSIPFNAGWALKVDGLQTPMFRANFGMLAAPVAGGRHSVELVFRTPGRQEGWLLGALGLGLLLVVTTLRRRSAAQRGGAASL
nr:YfhO family protein [Rhodoferax sp.]